MRRHLEPAVSAALQVHLTAQGSLFISAAIAESYFPGSSLVALPRPPELWLRPINASGGGELDSGHDQPGAGEAELRELIPP